VNVTLTTACGNVCSIAAGNAEAISVVQFLAGAMQLPTSAPEEASAPLWVFVEKRIASSFDGLVCRMAPAVDIDMLAGHMIWLSPLFTRSIEFGGGALIHGALAEYQGSGVIFAGPGGIGKSTVSRRLPASFRSLSDDMALIERDADGAYWAHPWPTWSSFMWGGSGGSWDVQYAIPLKAIFILEQSDRTRIEECGAGQAAMLLQEVADQASFFAYDSLDHDLARRHRVARFGSVCSLALSVPTAIIHTTLNAPFREEIETFLCRSASVSQSASAQS
jgi:SynChlorMet cassette protein ScmC